MDAHWILGELIFDYAGIVAANAPNQHSALIVTIKDAVLQDKRSKFTNNSDSLFIGMAFDLAIPHREQSLFF